MENEKISKMTRKKMKIFNIEKKVWHIVKLQIFFTFKVFTHHIGIVYSLLHTTTRQISSVVSNMLTFFHLSRLMTSFRMMLCTWWQMQLLFFIWKLAQVHCSRVLVQEQQQYHSASERLRRFKIDETLVRLKTAHQLEWTSTVLVAVVAT